MNTARPGKAADDQALLELPDEVLVRQARHLVLPQMGPAGQLRLTQAHVALVGMGGIGCPAAQYLAASGVGQLTLIDDDVVETSNLGRQILFSQADVGRPKVEAAAQRLAANNPLVKIQAASQRLEADNALQLLGSCDLILDGSDNHETRLLSASTAATAKIGLLSASVIGVEGQLVVQGPSDSQGYEQIFPTLSARQGNCADEGVLSPAAGMVGTLAACIALQVLAQGWSSLEGQVALISAWPPNIMWISA